jgi:hypothetical protein
MQDRKVKQNTDKEGTMVRRILIGISALLAGVLVTWLVANAGVGMKAPEITNETWLNSTPLHLSDLKDKVVMVKFWTFGCYNCRNVEPYVKQWHQMPETGSAWSLISLTATPIYAREAECTKSSYGSMSGITHQLTRIESLFKHSCGGALLCLPSTVS